jgi:hypothetical protein
MNDTATNSSVNENLVLYDASHQNVATITFHCVADLILVAFLDIVNVAEKEKSSPFLVTPL